jgi:carbon-monoxide dehydrogenase medium subunit
MSQYGEHEVMQYARPSILADALAILAAGGTPLAGGTLSVPAVVNAAAGSRDPFFVDLAGLPALHGVAERDGFLHVGAMVTLAEVAASTLIADSWTALAEAARAVGNPNVRRAATVGGNVAWRTGAPDLHAALLVLGGVVECATAAGPLALTAGQAVDESIPEGALITSIRLPREPGRVSSFVKFAWRGASGQTIVAVAGSFDLTPGAAFSPRLAASGGTVRAARLPAAEALLATGISDPNAVEAAATTAAGELPFQVEHLPAEGYRRRLLAEGVRRVLTAVVRR